MLVKWRQNNALSGVFYMRTLTRIVFILFRAGQKVLCLTCVCGFLIVIVIFVTFWLCLLFLVSFKEEI